MTTLELVQPDYEIERVDSPTGRYYITPDGDYPSVTTVLAEKPNPALHEWRQRIGEAEANRIAQQSRTTGNTLHKAAEYYILGKELPYMTRGVNLLFKQIRQELAHVDEVYGIELPLFSDRLKLAGSADLIARYKGVRSVIDFKNSRKEKSREWITSYFLQSTIYAMMFMERFGIPVPSISIFVAVWSGNRQVFTEKVVDWIPKVQEFMKEYHPMWG